MIDRRVRFIEMYLDSLGFEYKSTGSPFEYVTEPSARIVDKLLNLRKNGINAGRNQIMGVSTEMLCNERMVFLILPDDDSANLNYDTLSTDELITWFTSRYNRLKRHGDIVVSDENTDNIPDILKDLYVMSRSPTVVNGIPVMIKSIITITNRLEISLSIY